MDLHPWDYWGKSGKAKPWTPEILEVLEYVLEQNPHHLGANHFYIHAVEASKSPDRGLPSAERLGDVVPGEGHMVHMPSHIYIRVGKYHEGTLANERAINSDDSYVTQCRAQGIYPLAYVPHNHHFLWATATLEGASEKAIAAAKSTSAKVDTVMMRQPGYGTLQHFRVIPLYAYVRFGKWDEILAYPKAADDLIYPQGVWHYARGIAFARTGRFEEAERELSLIKKISVNPTLDDITIWDINRTDQLMEIAVNALAGELAAARGNYKKAISHLQAAVEIEDSLTYNEPPDWFFPVRHSLGAVLIEAGRPADAERVYRTDLETFPENGWSLFGLKKSLELQNKKNRGRAGRNTSCKSMGRVRYSADRISAVAA
jgi:tetratricopeptide (TPR) repeat protein